MSLFAPRFPGPGDTVTAISLWEPWGSLMRTGAKTIETRHWPIRHRGPLLICAAARKNQSEMRELLAMPSFQEGLQPLFSDPDLPLARIIKGRPIQVDHLLYGHAVALVYLYACRTVEGLTLGDIEKEREFGNYSSGRYAWMTRGLQRFKPFPVKGHQGLFSVRLPDGLVLAKVAD